MMSRNCGFNKTAQHVTQLVPQSIYGKTRLSLVYADKPQTLDYLEDNIRRVIADIRPQMLEKVIENWTSRLNYIRASRGSPMPEIIFKIYSGIVPPHCAQDSRGSFVSSGLGPKTGKQGGPNVLYYAPAQTSFMGGGTF
ncbi:hypothetical protein TNCV_3902931 [Trichonephila clavipes]|nr:hypothetical protein TNCV_3902931 [Trichonephila clavipes]